MQPLGRYRLLSHKVLKCEIANTFVTKSAKTSVKFDLILSPSTLLPNIVLHQKFHHNYS